jgi:hypothetical protein
VISNVVQEELERGPADLRWAILQEVGRIEFELATEDLESRALFGEYLAARIVTARYQSDLRHVAVATIARVDALVSWNFRHLVNLRTRRAVHAVNVRLGYPLIEIVSPEEV